MKAFKSPIAPIALRWSIAFCTSSGGVIALMKKSTSSMPYLPNSSATFARVPAAISSYLLGRSSRLTFGRAQQVRQPRDDQVLEIAADFVGREFALRADDRADQQLGIDDAERVFAETPQPHDAEILVAERDRLPRAPFLVQKRLLADEVDLGLKRRFFPRDRQDPRQDRHVRRRQRVPPRPKDVQRLAVAKEDRLLVLLHDQLRPSLMSAEPSAEPDARSTYCCRQNTESPPSECPCYELRNAEMSYQGNRKTGREECSL